MSVDVSTAPPLVDQFRRDIVTGVYNARERLVELDLAERYSVTRSAMRAALLELTAEGLVERQPNRGARVRALSVQEGIEIAETRRELEGLCARLAAERATDADRDDLRRIVAEMRDAFTSLDSARYLNANSTFHTAILRIARHEVAARILTQLGNLNFNRHFPMAFGARVPQISMSEHERVAEAILRGDGDEAQAAMHDHLNSLIEVLRAQSTAPA